MDTSDEIKRILDKNDGWLQLKEALDLGISKQSFYNYAKESGLERVGHGIYIADDIWNDAMHLIHLRSEQVIFSHETALFLHDMTDREPLHYSVTVKTGYNPHRLKEDGIKVYTIKEELHEMGLTQAKTPFGHLVPVYDKERTICDIVRSRRSIEAQVFQEALKAYGEQRDKNLRALMKYADALKVTTILKPYLEMIL